MVSSVSLTSKVCFWRCGGSVLASFPCIKDAFSITGIIALEASRLPVSVSTWHFTATRYLSCVSSVKKSF